MIQIDSGELLRNVLGSWASRGERWCLVPTMGNLHTGHLRLMSTARRHARRVLATIFVNPTQFGPNEDFSAYPRTPDDDLRALRDAGADAVFMPQESTIYPLGMEAAFRISTGTMGLDLCGKHRPGHFDGVATVVTRLFAMTRPHVAVFGKKDFQQLLVLRALNRDLGFGIHIVAEPTAREPDGLAMSSRNRYLTDSQRRQAPHLYATLAAARDAVLAGQTHPSVEARSVAILQEKGFSPEYFSLRRSSDLGPALEGDRNLIWLAAARLGKARLIDNIDFTKD